MSRGAEEQGSRGAEERTSFSIAASPYLRTAAQFVQAAAATFDITVTAHEPLARHTTFRIGGPADLYVTATTLEQLARLAELAAEYDIPATILGGGSNVLISDAGVRGLVIANQTRNSAWRISESTNQRISESANWRIGELANRRMDESANRRIGESANRRIGESANQPSASCHQPSAIGHQPSAIGQQPSASGQQPSASGQQPSANPQLVADSGVALAGLARTAIKVGWSGLEWAVSVPGTVGGAVIGNAGAHGGDIAGNLAWTLVAYPGQGRQTLTATEMAFTYRSSILKTQLGNKPGCSELPGRSEPRPVVLAAAFNLVPGDVAEMAARADSFLARRRASQPVEPSAGSIFHNPAGAHAGRLIEAAGLKGHRIGGAQISPRHANFIVNTGQASAADVVALMNLMRQRVYDNTGIELVAEILLLGDWSQCGFF